MESFIQGCHLVGSIPFNSADEVFRRCMKEMPNCLKRIPDGETGDRNYFVMFQRSVLPNAILSNFKDNSQAEGKPLTESQKKTALDEFKALTHEGIKTGYDSHAIESYQTFLKLRCDGIIASGVKFQVCLPTMANVVGVLVDPAFQEQVERPYETALFNALQKIQEEISEHDLAIQIDLGMDMAYWEGKVFKPWFKEKQYVVEYVARMIDRVNPGVDLGLHYCYGDMEHKHFTEPDSLDSIVGLHEQIIAKTKRSINWIHCPVPQSARNPDKYLEPLKRLNIDDSQTELYLGLVHAGDLEGTQIRIAEAKKVVTRFGVATECGWGRTASEDIQSIMEISNKVCERVRLA